jgi:hypothetical protein
MNRFLPTFFCLLFLSTSSFCQSNNDASQIPEIKKSLEFYDSYMGAQANIYNGPEYVPLLFKKEGTPFFDSDSLRTGWVSYENYIYKPLQIQYDVSKDQLIILNFDKKSRIFLQNDVVDSFYFGNHTFTRLNKDPQQNLNNAGFYEILFNGNTKVLAQRKKNIRETIKGNEVIRIFSDADRFYIKKNEKYYEVRNENDVFRALGKGRNEIKRALRQQNIKFRNNFEEALLTAAKIFDQLT